METATRLFGRGGYGATRMQDIATELDLQAGSLYYYFDSKESLLAAIVEHNVGAALQTLEAIVEEPLDAVSRIERALAAHLLAFADHPDLYPVFSTERHAISAELAETVDELGRRYERLWMKLIDDGMTDGSLRDDLDPWVTMKAIIGMCNSTFMWFVPGGRFTPDDVAAAFAEIVLAGITTEA